MTDAIGLKKLVLDIKARSVYLMDRECYIEEIFDPIKKVIPFAAMAITGVSGTGFDLRGIICGYPAKYLAIYTNKNHAKLDFYSDSFKEAAKHGCHTKIYNDCAKAYPEDYKERYEPFGFKCGQQTNFCDSNGNLLGTFGGLRNTSSRFTKPEQAAISTISPYMFYAFMKYRWLVQADFFNITDFDNFQYGLITSSEAGRLTYLNDAARQLLGVSDRTAPKTLPKTLMEIKKQLDAVPAHDDSRPCLAFQSIESYVSQYGLVVCFRFDAEHGGRYLPVKGMGYAFFIDVRKKDMAQKALLSERELAVLRHIGHGLQDREIARELGLSEKTVQTYVQRIFGKLDTDNRTEAAVKAIRLGLV